jgi:hypothetical protein
MFSILYKFCNPNNPIRTCSQATRLINVRDILHEFIFHTYYIQSFQTQQQIAKSIPNNLDFSLS